MDTQTEARTAPQKRRGLGAVADQAWLLMIAPPLFWAGNVIMGRMVHDILPPVGLAFWRWTLASLLALPLALPYFRRDFFTLLRNGPFMVLMALLGVASFNTLLYIAADTTNAINMVTLQTATPVIIVAVSYFLFGQLVTARQGLGIAFSLVGALTLISHGDLAALIHLQINPGDILLGTAVIAYAIYTALLRRAPPVHPFSFLFATFVLSALMLFPLYLGETFIIGEVMPLSWQAFTAIGYTAVFPSILAYLAYNRAVVLLGANVAGLSLHLIPVFGVLLSAALLGELPQIYHFIGIALIFAGIFLATRKRQAGGTPA